MVTSTIALRAGEPFVRIRTAFTNSCRDHRLRTHIPLPVPVDQSHAECAFTVVARGLTTEGGPNEAPLPTWVSRRFVDASNGGIGVALLHTGLLEYELIDRGNTLALTLMRAVGYLSRSEMALRPNPAGPLLPVVGAQMQRHHVCEYAIYPHRGTWDDAHCYAAADAFATPIEVISADPIAPTLASTGQALAVSGAVVSSVRRTHTGTLEIRCFNPSAQATDCTLMLHGTPVTGHVINLRGRVLGPFSGTQQLRSGEILTVQVDEGSSASS